MSELERRLSNLSPEKAALLQELLLQRKRGGDHGGLRQRDPQTTVPLSFTQQRLWFLEQLGVPGGAYSVPIQIRIDGPLEVKALRRSLESMVQGHEILRTQFVLSHEKPFQRVSTESVVELSMMDLSSWSSEQRQIKASAAMQSLGARRFDLTELPLFRSLLLKVTETEHWLHMVFHHIIGDRLSSAVIVNELESLYRAGGCREASELPDLEYQYGDFVIWQRERLSDERKSQLMGYWRQQLRGIESLRLPLDHPRPPVETFRSGSVTFELSEETTAELRMLGRREGATLFMSLLACYQLLLHRYTQQDCVVVGSPIGNRERPELEGMIGLFVNMIVLRADFGDDPSFAELLARVKQTSTAAYEHQALPFEVLVEELQPERDRSRNPIFQTLFAHQKAEDSPMKRKGHEVSFCLNEAIEVGAQIDLEMHILERQDWIQGCCVFKRELFDETTVKNLALRFQQLVATVIREPGRRTSEFDLLTDGECAQITKWNATERRLDDGLRIHDLFAAAVKEHHGAIAVQKNGDRISYGALDARSNQIAHYLQDHGVQVGDRVGVCLDRTVDLVGVLLGILKSGACYVPLDASHPGSRLNQILEDAEVTLLLTSEPHHSLFDSESTAVVCMDQVVEEIGRCSEASVESPVRSSDLSHILYTSGSTGEPKGVAVEHRNTVAMLSAAMDTYDADDVSGVLASLSISFDASVFELFVPLVSGGKVILVDNLLALADMDATSEISMVTAAPSAVLHVVREGLFPSGARVLNVGGEALRGKVVREVFANTAVNRIYNQYGPSECTTYSTVKEFTRDRGEDPSIGRPIANTRIYLLDRYRSPVPIGMVGEIYIGGAGVTRGYLGQPELTEERFLDLSIDGITRERVYRTGDLGEYDPHGEIRFHGRVDHQVKLRGFRIEPDAVETLLCRHPAVTGSVVMLIGERAEDPNLEGFVTLFSGKVEGEEVRDPQAWATEVLIPYLRGQLPDYMVPSYLNVMEAFPLLANGKIDRNALMTEGMSRVSRMNSVERPKGGLEEQIAVVWQEVLGLSKLPGDGNFFDYGGHSLLLPSVRSRLVETLGGEIALPELFEFSTIRAQASYFAKKRQPEVSQGVQSRANQRLAASRRIARSRRSRGASHG